MCRFLFDTAKLLEKQAKKGVKANKRAASDVEPEAAAPDPKPEPEPAPPKKKAKVRAYSATPRRNLNGTVLYPSDVAAQIGGEQAHTIALGRGSEETAPCCAIKVRAGRTLVLGRCAIRMQGFSLSKVRPRGLRVHFMHNKHGKLITRWNPVTGNLLLVTRLEHADLDGVCRRGVRAVHRGRDGPIEHAGSPSKCNPHWEKRVTNF